ncbi:hypothetical protein [Paraburkholderia metrosideri]|uniref:Twin-arginine translocation pathway signal protein n=1 Tax=Paraburkholderia metrosideri TaxID=580937 RepID=A0ABM8P5T8_9BURK|nr:hypothetical protein [Paraburkholderia metrosideri]CAD6557059.1 hypothetical protein LMG28140_06054 [Paraburkholderia metrosideri]
MSTRGVAPSRWSIVLASGATGTAICMSVLAGWQRGGRLPERLVWVAIGIVLVIAAHLLPALTRTAPRPVRWVAGCLWVACMAATCYGHATFFLLAQQHAGENRAASVTPMVATFSGPSGRSLAAIMTERAKVTGALAVANTRHCARDCSAVLIRRVSLAAQLDALNAQADEARRRQVTADRDAARRELLLGDPVSKRLAATLGTSVTRIDLLSGLAYAAILEGVACLLWTVTLQSRTTAVVTPAAINPVALSHVSVSPSHAPIAVPGTESVTSPVPRGSPDTEVMGLARDVAAGHVRATVADIRRHLGCSQARAAALRKRLGELSQPS